MNANIFSKIYGLYADGFRNMRLGKTLWLLIIIKLLIMFLILKLFFFRETINTKFDSQADKVEFILDNLTKE